MGLFQSKPKEVKAALKYLSSLSAKYEFRNAAFDKLKLVIQKQIKANTDSFTAAGSGMSTESIVLGLIVKTIDAVIEQEKNSGGFSTSNDLLMQLIMTRISAIDSLLELGSINESQAEAMKKGQALVHTSAKTNEPMNEDYDGVIQKLFMSMSPGQYKDVADLNCSKEKLWTELEQRALYAHEHGLEKDLSRLMICLSALTWYQPNIGLEPVGMTDQLMKKVQAAFDAGDSQQAAEMLASGGASDHLVSLRDEDEKRLKEFAFDVVGDWDLWIESQASVVTSGAGSSHSGGPDLKSVTAAIEVILDASIGEANESPFYLLCKSGNDQLIHAAHLSLGAIVLLALKENDYTQRDECLDTIAHIYAKYIRCDASQADSAANKYYNRLIDESDELAESMLWKFSGPISQLHSGDDQTQRAAFEEMGTLILAFTLMAKGCSA